MSDSAVKAVPTIDEIKEKLSPIFERERVKRAVLYGDFARGKYDRLNSMDILVDSGKRGFAFFGLNEECCVALDNDYVAMREECYVEEGSPTDIAVKETGILIYGR